VKHLFQQKTRTNWNCHHVDLFCATPPFTLGRHLSETALLCCHPLVYFLKVVVKNQPLPNYHQRRQKIKREPKRSKGIQRDQNRSRESKRDHKNSQEIGKKSKEIERDQERSRKIKREHKRSKNIKRDQERSRKKKHEVDHCTKWKKQQDRKHPQGHCGPGQSRSGKWLRERAFAGNQNHTKERWHAAQASCNSVQDACLTSKSACVCVCVIYIPMQSTVTCVNVSFWGSNRQIYIVDIVVQICKDLRSVRKLSGLQLRCVNLPGEVEVKSPFRCATLTLHVTYAIDDLATPVYTCLKLQHGPCSTTTGSSQIQPSSHPSSVS